MIKFKYVAITGIIELLLIAFIIISLFLELNISEILLLNIVAFMQISLFAMYFAGYEKLEQLFPNREFRNATIAVYIFSVIFSIFDFSFIELPIPEIIMNIIHGILIIIWSFQLIKIKTEFISTQKKMSYLGIIAGISLITSAEVLLLVSALTTTVMEITFFFKLSKKYDI